jgi:SAM-dependent methyltransferase
MEGRVVSFCEQVYQKRWTKAELLNVGRVWETLVKEFFQSIVGQDAKVLDIGCGFCHFLNNVEARERVGVDANPAAKDYASSDVMIHSTTDLSLPTLPNQYFDCVFLSNFLEHLESSTQVIDLLKRVKDLLRPEGKIIILQPNFRLLGPAYFDFIDHKTILTDKSLEEALTIAGFTVKKKIIRFLPYTTKSRIPQHAMLVRLYLWCKPLWFFMGKQSLFVATTPASTIVIEQSRPATVTRDD